MRDTLAMLLLILLTYAALWPERAGRDAAAIVTGFQRGLEAARTERGP